MSLLGDLSTMPLTELLQWLAVHQKSGVLLLQREDVVKEISLLGGKIVASASNDPREQFSQFLLACGKISEDDLLTLLLLQRDLGIPLGRLLVQRGILQEGEVQHLLRLKAEENIHDLFLWDEGYFKFFAEAPVQERHVPIEMDLTTLMLEGHRRADEWQRIRAVFPSSETAVRVIPDRLTRDLLQEPVYNRMIQLLEVPRRITDVCLMFHLSDYAVSKTLFNLYEMGILEVVETALPAVQAKEPGVEEHVGDLIARGQAQFEAGRLEEALDTFRQALILSPGNPLADEMEETVSQALRERLLGAEIGPDQVPILLQPMEDLDELAFTPQENYILSQVNGRSNVGAILQLSPLQETQGFLAFKSLLQKGLIGFVEAQREGP
jgi:tetratricopeptide (TPR) repeat protein